MNKKTQGTWINFSPGLRPATDLLLLGSDKNRTQFVTELVEDAVIEQLEAMPHDVGATLEVMYSGKGMGKKYRELVKKVHIRQGIKQAQPEEAEEGVIEEIEEEYEAEPINVDILKEITESS